MSNSTRNTVNYDNIKGHNHTPLSEGDPAPAFKIDTNLGKPLTLGCFKGHHLVLYFYPKDNTPGCTSQAQDFNNILDHFAKLNCKVLGISKDKIATHNKFAEKYNLKFPLGSDEEFHVCNKYHVYKEKNMYGKKVMGIERSTFLINPDGNLTKIWRKVSVKGHVANVYEELKKVIKEG